MSAGASPGPLTTVIVAQTLKHGSREGVKVATAPLFTDLPIICLALLLISRLPDPQFLAGMISYVGAAFVFMLGIASIRQQPVEITTEGVRPRSFLKGWAVNMLSPHPYLFWFSVGVPTIVAASDRSTWAAAGFVVCFFTCIVGTKMTIALIIGRYRDFLSGRIYLWTMRFLGVCLIGFSFVLVYEGLKLTGVVGGGCSWERRSPDRHSNDGLSNPSNFRCDVEIIANQKIGDPR